jgi:hypothetical protein
LPMLCTEAMPSNTAQIMPSPKHALNSNLNTLNSRLLNPYQLGLGHLRLTIRSVCDTITILLHGLGNIGLSGQ